MGLPIYSQGIKRISPHTRRLTPPREYVIKWPSMSVQTEPFKIKMNRKGFGKRAQIREVVQDVYKSDIIDQIRQAGYCKKFGRFNIHLAQEFGFCYGVDRAVELAYETRQQYPNKRIFLTTEIIHNPTVNQNLEDMGIKFLSKANNNANIDNITKEDVVLVPAFGTTISELRELHNTSCILVDTICGSVIVVWKRVEKYARHGFTSIIHGKYYHEETQATSSQVLQFQDAHFLIVLNKDEAQYVCNYVLNGGNKDKFIDKFKLCMSPGFDPDKHLQKVGLANQTTMLASESLEICEMFKKTLVQKYGHKSLDNHHMSFDTICSATQERQDAIIDMTKKNLDLIIVVGGYNSSNTTQLHKIALDSAPSYHINLPECILDQQTIRHKPHGKNEEITSSNWLPKGEISIGITAGASTPNGVMGEVLDRIIAQ